MPLPTSRLRPQAPRRLWRCSATSDARTVPWWAAIIVGCVCREIDVLARGKYGSNASQVIPIRLVSASLDCRNTWSPRSAVLGALTRAKLRPLTLRARYAGKRSSCGSLLRLDQRNRRLRCHAPDSVTTHQCNSHAASRISGFSC